MRKVKDVDKLVQEEFRSHLCNTYGADNPLYRNWIQKDIKLNRFKHEQVYDRFKKLALERVNKDA